MVPEIVGKIDPQSLLVRGSAWYCVVVCGGVWQCVAVCGGVW